MCAESLRANGDSGISALVYMITVFNDLARYAEQACPDVDIPEFLVRAGIRAASDE